ncbi:MAG: AzlC family ABC transporter permease [Anaerolineae bacterium]|nr:AzlC family ABC transporter permease [Anaerolineae bacterium]MDH7473268.1 AzlC family ABC transporter permease [Anaerolineae bacterium]
MGLSKQARQGTFTDFRRGLIATVPLIPGVVVFGLLYGVMARQVGLSPWETWAMSLVVHAGSAQFTALGMWASAGTGAIVLTTLAINLRHLLMGASVAPHLLGLPQRWRPLLALWMSDESYAVSITAYRQGIGSAAYFLGANVGIYLAWPASGLVGALLGTVLPDPARYGLDLVFPLAFLGLLMAFIEDRKTAAVAVVAGLLAIVGSRILSGQWHVLVAGLLASLGGILLEEVERMWRRR